MPIPDSVIKEIAGARIAIDPTLAVLSSALPPAEFSSGPFVTVISHDFWRRRFGADPNIVGKKISINNYPFTIIGVAAQDFNDVEVGVAPDVRVPMVIPIGFGIIAMRLKPAEKTVKMRSIIKTAASRGLIYAAGSIRC